MAFIASPFYHTVNDYVCKFLDGTFDDNDLRFMHKINSSDADSIFRCTEITNTNALSHWSTIGSHTFFYCQSLITANFPVCTSIGSSAFYGCQSLTTASFPVCTRIENGAFNGCSSLASIYFTGTSIPTLNNVDAFGYTPLSNSTYIGKFGSIYVRSSLLNSFKTAANWSQYSARMVGV